MSSSLTVQRASRVLMTTDALGGVWSYALDLARGLIEAGVDVFLAVLGPRPSADQCAAVPHGAHLLFTDLPLDWTAASRAELEHASEVLALMAARLGVDVAHLHAPALIGQAIWKMPVVAVAHSCVGTWWQAVRKGPLPADLAWRHDMARLGLQRADAVIAPSQAFACALQQLHGNGFSIRVVNNGRRPAGDTRPDCRNTAVLAVGRLWDEGKNFAIMDECASLLDIPVLAAGQPVAPNGSTRSFPHLRALGVLSATEMQALYARAAVFVSASVYEPFGLAALEAAMTGLPLVLSDIPSFREIWSDAAAFCPPYDPKAFATAVSDLLSDPARRKEAGTAARRRAARYTVARMTAETAAVHIATLRQNPQRAA